MQDKKKKALQSNGKPTNGLSHKEIPSKKNYTFHAQDLKEQALRLAEAGYQPIPLRVNSKIPAIRWEEYQSRKITKEEIEKLQWRGVGLILGSISNGLVVLDADTPMAIRLLENHPVLKDTAKVRTPSRNGLHYYLRIIDYPHDGIKKAQLYAGDEIKIDLLADRSMAVIPPTQINGKSYVWEKDLTHLKELSYKNFCLLLDEINATLKGWRFWKKTLEVIKEVYVKGKRQFLNLYLAGYLAKKGVPEFGALAFLSMLWEDMKDDQVDQRERAVKDTYKDYREGKPISGWDGLRGHLPSDVLDEIDTIWNTDKEPKGNNDTMEKNKIKGNKQNTKARGKTIVNGDFVIDDGEVQMLTRKGFITIGPYVHIKTVLFDKDEEKRIIVGEYDGDTFSFTLREAKEKIEEFTSQFIRQRKEYLIWLSEEVKRVPQKRLIKSTGWSEGLTEFYHPYFESEFKNWVIDEKHILKREKRFTPIYPDVQEKLVYRALKEGKYLAFLYVAANSNILLYPLEIDPYVIIVTGESEKGKSTTTSLAVQLFYRNNPPIANAYQTGNSWEFYLKDFLDLPFLFDEMGLLKSELVEFIAFAVNSGYGKSRGNVEKRVDRSKLRSVVILNAEKFPHSEIKNAGVHRRVLHLAVTDESPLTDIIFTPEEKKASGFGLKLIEFTKSYLEQERHKIEKLQSLPPLQRVLYVSLSVFEKYFGEAFPQAGKVIDKVLDEQRKVFKEEKDHVQKFLDRLRQEIFSNRGFYVDPKGVAPEDMKNMRGRVEVTDKETRIDILPKYLDALMRDEKGEDVLNKDLILHELKKRGILQTEEGRFQRTVSIKGYKVRVYSFILKNDDNAKQQQ